MWQQEAPHLFVILSKLVSSSKGACCEWDSNLKFYESQFYYQLLTVYSHCDFFFRLYMKSSSAELCFSGKAKAQQRGTYKLYLINFSITFPIFFFRLSSSLLKAPQNGLKSLSCSYIVEFFLWKYYLCVVWCVALHNRCQTQGPQVKPSPPLHVTWPARACRHNHKLLPGTFLRLPVHFRSDISSWLMSAFRNAFTAKSCYFLSKHVNFV